MKYSILILLCLVLSLSSCADKNNPNYQYFPDMYQSLAYETYQEATIFPNEQEAMLPVEGTIPRGWLPYNYKNNPEGYNLAKAELKNPLVYSEENLKKGQELFNIYCATCHGQKGDGQGWLVQQEKILGVPAYDDQGRAITEGSTYHVMYYGINTMGSYASQMSEKELWQVDHYVMKLKAELEGKPERAFETEKETKQDVENTVEEEVAITE
ncbi:c-type cytochrome [Psychroflexus sp. MBR-150]|jgi:mono/diheme cytochrome c family protein